MAATLLSGVARFTNGPLCNVPGRPGNIDYRTLQMPNAKLNERGSDHGNGFGFRCRCKTLLHKPSDLVGQIGDGPAKRRWGKQPIMRDINSDCRDSRFPHPGFRPNDTVCAAIPARNPGADSRRGAARALPRVLQVPARCMRNAILWLQAAASAGSNGSMLAMAVVMRSRLSETTASVGSAYKAPESAAAVGERFPVMCQVVPSSV